MENLYLPWFLLFRVIFEFAFGVNKLLDFIAFVTLYMVWKGDLL